MDSATQRLLRALVELAFYDTLNREVAPAVRDALWTRLRDILPSTATAVSSPCSGLALARSLRTRECPLEVCCSVFHDEVIRTNLLSWGGVLGGLYHLHVWEEEEDDDGGACRPALDAAEEQLRAAGRVTENLDCLFLRLRASPELFAAAAAAGRSSTTTEGAEPPEAAELATAKRKRTSASLPPRNNPSRRCTARR